ncbi:MAG: carbohydrate ABC transporter permease [Halolamina sp.]
MRRRLPTLDGVRRLLADARDAPARRWALYTVLGALLAFFLSPLEAGLMTAFKTSEAFRTSVPIAPPGLDGFSIEPWLIASRTLGVHLFNSVLLAVPAAALSALFGSLAAYGLTGMNWRGQVGVVVLFVAGIFIPYQAVLIPLSRFWSIVDTSVLFPTVINHYSSILDLIITHTAYGIPITTLLFRSYYKNLSDEMLEAARLDGASAATIYRRIIYPLSKPMFAVALIYQFTQIWNDLLFALVIIPSGSGPAAVVTIAVNELTGGIIQSFNTQMAGAFVAAIPTLLVYILFGEKFAKGVASEA